ncbi:bifunctional adenosylcobinamide kinase/adenosylcobinamide-phosphate guanylyltransferase [Desulfitibacter alkalitolerans]|uniref:bifunctional adenosylcobinamide kinase/adenosylcobinamide-phosphate guanylyltransferase n=1 Tax=Desulfitibacter alkalitolerans TaxID=264641 RepID=UPI00054CF88F|nr:bifunctional adenosylcobinamide kinase/adenosylcobinamide-phosphate guanylyltransferase [Desulfitibacter alkalitolerans]
MARIVMVVGGSSSGKSVFAEKMAHDLEQKQAGYVTYVATGTIWDHEFAKRVEKHKNRRPESWGIIEEPHNLHDALANNGDNGIFLIDGIGTWVTNLMYAISPKGEEQPRDFIWNKEHEDKFAGYLRLFIEACKNFNGTIIMVADEVGMDVVPFYKEARVFRDLNGMANQQLAQYAEEVHLVVCGISLQIK